MFKTFVSLLYGHTSYKPCYGTIHNPGSPITRRQIQFKNPIKRCPGRTDIRHQGNLLYNSTQLYIIFLSVKFIHRYSLQCLYVIFDD